MVGEGGIVYTLTRRMRPVPRSRGFSEPEGVREGGGFASCPVLPLRLDERKRERGEERGYN